MAFAPAVAGLPRSGPREGFVYRVLLRAVIAGRSPAWWPAVVHLAHASCLIAAGLALANVPVLVTAWTSIAPVLIVSVVVPALTWLGGAMTLAAESWACIERVASAMRGSLATSTVVVVLAVNLLVAAASLAGLKRL